MQYVMKTRHSSPFPLYLSSPLGGPLSDLSITTISLML